MRYAVVPHTMNSLGELDRMERAPTGFATLGDALRYSVAQGITSSTVYLIVRFLDRPGEVTLEEACHSGLMSCHLPFAVVQEAFRRWAAAYCLTNTPPVADGDDEVFDLKETRNG